MDSFAVLAFANAAEILEAAENQQKSQKKGGETLAALTAGERFLSQGKVRSFFGGDVYMQAFRAATCKDRLGFCAVTVSGSAAGHAKATEAGTC